MLIIIIVLRAATSQVRPPACEIGFCAPWDRQISVAGGCDVRSAANCRIRFKSLVFELVLVTDPITRYALARPLAYTTTLSLWSVDYTYYMSCSAEFNAKATPGY
jgi:hypothetical protein